MCFTTHLLIEKRSYFSVNLIKEQIFKPKCGCLRKSMQEKESIMDVRCELKIPSLGIIVRHHSASLVMPNRYPRDGISICISQPLKILIMFIRRQKNRSNMASSVAIYSRHPTRDFGRHDVPNYRITSIFYVCDVGLCNSDSKFQTTKAPVICE